MGLIWTPSGTGLSGTGADPANALAGLTPVWDTGSNPGLTIPLGLSLFNTNYFPAGDPLGNPLISMAKADINGYMPDDPRGWTETLTSWYQCSVVGFDGSLLPSEFSVNALYVPYSVITDFGAVIDTDGNIYWYEKTDQPARYLVKVHYKVYYYDGNNTIQSDDRYYYLDLDAIFLPD